MERMGGDVLFSDPFGLYHAAHRHRTLGKGGSKDVGMTTVKVGDDMSHVHGDSLVGVHRVGAVR
jgi:hypothetical protein